MSQGMQIKSASDVLSRLQEWATPSDDGDAIYAEDFDNIAQEIGEPLEKLKTALELIVDCQYKKDGTLASLNSAVARGRKLLEELK